VLVASRLFADEYLMKCLDPVFAKELKYYYDSDVEGVPFSKDPPTAWKAINTFVEEKTNGIVSDFMKRLEQKPRLTEYLCSQYYSYAKFFLATPLGKTDYIILSNF
jgi:serine protease inhibitor